MSEVPRAVRNGHKQALCTVLFVLENVFIQEKGELVVLSTSDEIELCTI